MIESGRRVGRYDVQERRGRGGMGTVYRAWDTTLKREVAIKVLLADLDVPDAQERFVREASHAAGLNHVNIVTVYDAGDFAGQPYIVMEYVVGESLADIIRRVAPVSLLEKLRWMDELCAGVAFAHQMQVLHRDIKPTNLMIDKSRRLKIVDFGIAKMLGTLTTNGSGLGGTPGYMAPEQILGDPIDARSDLFSIGAVCYELLAYVEAFGGETVPTISHRVLNEEPARLVDLVPGIDLELVAAVERALAKKVDDRFPNVSAMRFALDAVRRRVELAGGGEGFGATLTAPANRRPAGAPVGPAPLRGSSGRGDLSSTPPLNPRPGTGRTDDVPARMQALLARARVLLSKEDLDGALTACEAGLAMDETNAEALEVEHEIRAATNRRRAKVLLAEGRQLLENGELDEAQARLQQVRGLNTELTECARLESELRVLRTQYKPGTQGETIVVPARRPASRSSESERSVVPVPVPPPRPSTGRNPLPPLQPRRPDSGVKPPPQRPDSGAKPPPAQARRQTPADSSKAPVGPRPANKVPERPPAPPATLLARLAAVAARAASAARQRPRVVLSVAALLVVAVGAVVVMSLMPGATRVVPVPMGVLLIDAVPWGTVAAIRAADGTMQPLPPEASTPLLITLPEGSYRVTVVGPDDTKESREVVARVTAATLTPISTVRFTTITVDDYFEAYLTTPVDALPEQAGTSAEPTPSATSLQQP